MEKQVLEIVKENILKEYHNEMNVTVSNLDENGIDIDIDIAETNINFTRIDEADRDDFTTSLNKLLKNFDLSFNLEFTKDRQEEIKSFIS